MCGIFGEFSMGAHLLDENTFRRLNNLAILRGPDQEGYWSDRMHCQLGFRRLAILDLTSAGNQPMLSPDGRYVMVFNGEIYNATEIKGMLPYGKYHFKGHSDTEIILYAFESLGVEKTAALLDGMFGIALYDCFEQKLFLIRDFAGIKPLYFGFNGKRLVFASQYDQVTAHPSFRNNRIQPEVLKLYLRQHFVPSPFGIIEETAQVEPGQIIEFSLNGKINKYQFWEFPKTDIQYRTEREALDYLESSLMQAVRDEMISDVPLGTFLSGGIDSPLVTYFAKKNTRSSLKSFTIGSDSEIHDESADASRYAEMIGVELTLRRMNSRSALDILDKVMASLKEPFSDFSIIPTYMVSGIAKEQVTVVLSGDGGDELFFGYERFWSLLKNMKYFKVPGFLKYPLYAADKLFFHNSHLNSNFLKASIGEAHFCLHSRFQEDEIHNIIPALSKVNVPSDYSIYNYETSDSIGDMLWKMQKAEFYGMMQKTLQKVDRASMAHSLEGRVPMLKKSFIEASMRIDPMLSYGGSGKDSRKKDILKKLLRKKLPQSPISNQKRGFTVPLSKWIREDLRQNFHDVLTDNAFLQAFDIKNTKLEEMLKQHQDGKKDMKWQLFTLYALATWYRRNIA